MACLQSGNSQKLNTHCLNHNEVVISDSIRSYDLVFNDEFLFFQGFAVYDEMIPRGLLLVVIINIIGAESQLIFPRNVSRKPRMNSNKITDVDTSCTKDSMDVRVRMERPFKGVVFTKDFARECRSQGGYEPK